MRVYLGDLAHYTIKLQNNHTPLNIGFIAAYLNKMLDTAIEIKLFKNPHRLMRAIERESPDILGLSNYIWCQSVSEEMFKFYKKQNKNGIAVWGGPNFPMNELHKAKTYLTSRPYIDFYIPFEGETPFVNITKAVMEHGNDVNRLKNAYSDCFEGSFFLSDTGELIGKKIGVQIEDLNTIPSPYLQGWLDPFLDEGLHAMFETQRGCPYQCTFCHTGLSYYNRGRSFPLDRLKQEIEYITNRVTDPTKTHLYITDSNFGMWPQDLEFTRWLKEHYENTGFPLSFGTSTGKGRVQLVLETVMTHPKLMLTNSVQSLDEEVLKTIKRRNFPLDQLKYSQTELDAEGKLSQPEVILGLPNETRDSHLQTLRTLMQDIGANIIYQYTLMLLPGTEIYEDKMRQEHKYLVKYRLLPTSFGEYAGERTFEIEEVSVGTKDLSYAEYLEMREVFFFVHNFYCNAIYRSIVRFLLYLGADLIEFILYLMKKRKTKAYRIIDNIINDYIRDTESELFDSREELIQFYLQDAHFKDLLEGKKGINLTHTYRSIIFLHSKDWAAFIVQSCREFIKEKTSLDEHDLKLLDSIARHIFAQAECQHSFFKDHEDILTQKNSIEVELDFDVPEIFNTRIDETNHLVLKENKSKYAYFMKDDAVKYIMSFTRNQRLIDLALIVLRMDQSYLFPIYHRKDEASSSFQKSVETSVGVRRERAGGWE